ncbi:Uncharacterized protein APZ42_019761 [Daphnia magna]|uniref:Uncharacterized protein n=1 Tax=Daphnia magna TaxID=35525 RepID=A0A164XPB0_9CRUS|nr:Uncharacterized protein APZ42_019761 [Daphnia magna]
MSWTGASQTADRRRAQHRQSVDAYTPYSHSRICSSSHHASLYLPLYIAL